MEEKVPATMSTIQEDKIKTGITKDYDEPVPDEPIDDKENKGYDTENGGDEDDEEDDPLKENEWDEGGPSNCGYGFTVHDTLMSLGKTVHKIVGEPSTKVRQEMKVVGNWFQEASYAARDLVSGNTDEMAEDSLQAVTSIVRPLKSSDDDGTDKEDTKTEVSEYAPTDVGESIAPSMASSVRETPA
uniref:Uncharacterized protein n=1 Tax=Attheya septentrionalis TaxID=420275 RepID=A0A7S2US52_9STRA|mmetsp:Transcript_7233/g.12974  ORF Transcript_7233/g.12974 Transcript_7233/m.12974 type:complete len:186 (+) Transcript_7233:132-689(+)